MLRDLQTEFAAALLDEHPQLDAHVRAGRFPAAQHFQVYRNNLVESLTGALRAVYPVVEKLVGDGFFRYAAHEYLREHRPRSGNLHDFGDAFADFLAGFEPAAGAALPAGRGAPRMGLASIFSCRRRTGLRPGASWRDTGGTT